MVDYSQMPPDFYEQQANSMNKFRAWFHDSRNQVINKYIRKYNASGKMIADLGCGNVLWNKEKLPVIGVDVNEKYLDYNLSQRKITKKVVSPLDNIALEDKSVDIIVISEVLEHLPELDKHLLEIHRILKPGGLVISSVPYDTILSFWKPLFKVQCLYRGYLLGEQYYKENCGHINHFSKKSIANLFAKNYFKVIEQYNHYYFTIFTIAQK